jgi:hypothetical protein
MNKTIIILVLLFLGGYSCNSGGKKSPGELTVSYSQAFDLAAKNSQPANEAFTRCDLYVKGWLKHADPVTKLIPRNLDEDKTIWNARDAAADNYPFMVLSTAILTEDLNGIMREMLDSERDLTSRIGHLPDDYSFIKGDFLHDSISIDRIIFGASEYMKDGLMPLTEYLGASPWSERLLEILDELKNHVDVKESFEGRATAIEEINGEMLQVLSRMYWFTGKEEYLNWAIHIGDHYLLGDRHPTDDLDILRIRDHGCEIIAGLSELYFAVSHTRPEKKEEYRAAIHKMLDRILEIGRNPDGLFYNQVNPVTGEILDHGIADTWGYTLNAYMTVYQLDSTYAYYRAILNAIQGLVGKYTGFDWENGSADGYADAIEGALNLFNRIPNRELEQWIDSEIKVMWQKQQEDGIIEGWHGDGNFARTSAMYALWKTAGVTLKPWNENLKYGAIQKSDTLYIHVQSSVPWEGSLFFDRERHNDFLHLPSDYPRINQFQEWWTIKQNTSYLVTDCKNGYQKTLTGEELVDGLPFSLSEGEGRQYMVVGLSSVR